MYLLRLFVQNAAQAIRNAELNEKLLQNEKLSAVGQVISMVMHDLRTPIKNIHLITEMIREDGCSADLLTMIEKSAEQASEIFDDFMDFIKKTEIKKSDVHLQTILQETLAYVANRDGSAGIDISTDIPEDILVSGDAGKLRRCFGNILNNSIDALATSPLASRQIIVTANRKPESVQLSIADNGPGIPQDILENLFDPFVTKNKSGGTGLGLAIVRQYMEAHGGSVSVKNDKGAIFNLELPLTA